jgi:hypothetical protein
MVLSPRPSQSASYKVVGSDGEGDGDDDEVYY